MKYVTIDNDTLTLSVCGHYKFSLTKAINYEVQTAYQNGCTKAVVDCANTESLDSSGLRQLAGICRHVKEENFSVINAHGMVRSVIIASGLERWLK